MNRFNTVRLVPLASHAAGNGSQCFGTTLVSRIAAAVLMSMSVTPALAVVPLTTSVFDVGGAAAKKSSLVVATGFDHSRFDTGASNGILEPLASFGAGVAGGVVGAVPEPENCALLLAGLGMVGFSKRRPKIPMVLA